MNELLEWLDEQIAECLAKVDEYIDSDEPLDRLLAAIHTGYIGAFNSVKVHIKTKAAETELMDTEETE